MFGDTALAAGPRAHSLTCRTLMLAALGSRIK
jgi:hypothetical protein